MADLGLYFFIAVGLAMDAFAVSICKGLSMTKVRRTDAFVIALFFGGFQALMPFIGWKIGVQFEQYIKNIDHWIAFALLLLIGGKMLIESLRDKNDDDTTKNDEKLNLKEILVMATATSIDALAVGISFACLDYEIGEAMIVIGVITFTLSFVGVYIGNVFGAKHKRKAEIAGGVILVLIGTRILFDHLGVL